MTDYKKIYQQVYKKQQYAHILNKKANPLAKKGRRKNSVAVIGGFLGDEGKGRITDEFTANFLKTHKKVIHYRDNGGANAGHSVAVGDKKIALHQLGAGVLQKGCLVVSGKEMVIHPEDLLSEIEKVKEITNNKVPAQICIDEMAFLSLDTHRAFESALKARISGRHGSTDRGIAPAYADVVYRHPVRIRDLVSRNWKKIFTDHYSLYQDLIKGLGLNIAQIEVMRLSGKNIKVGTVNAFLKRLEAARLEIKAYVISGQELIDQSWDNDVPMVFEKAQALGLDKRWGVYPDVTASDCSFEGIFSSTEGRVDPNLIAIKSAAIKATYNSSVGSRKLPSMMKGKMVNRIREDAHEYGTTTGRPRDIVHIDLPMLSYLLKVGRVEYLVLTHMDICYLDAPIEIVIGYQKDGKPVEYRPDQEYLNTVKPIFMSLPSWDGQSVTNIKKIKDLPKAALQYLSFLEQALGVEILMVTTGPKREQTIRWY